LRKQQLKGCARLRKGDFSHLDAPTAVVYHQSPDAFIADQQVATQAQDEGGYAELMRGDDHPCELFEVGCPVEKVGGTAHAQGSIVLQRFIQPQVRGNGNRLHQAMQSLR
jgi:hypothetical protein